MPGNKNKQRSNSQKAKISRGLAKAISRRIVGKGAYGVYAGMPVGRPIQGQGGFWGDVWNSTKKFIPRVGGALAGYASNPTNPMLNAVNGWNAGANFSKNVLGWGKYRRPIVRGQGATIIDEGGAVHSVGSDATLASPVPAMHSADETVRVHKVEYLGDVLTAPTANTFQNRVIPLNPGICFYWGSRLAALFQQYRIEGAMVFFKSRASSYTANTTLGTVMICMDYNPHNEPFSTKQQMQETTGCVACSVDQNCSCAIECDPKMTMSPIKYVRTGEVPLGEDKHLYDWGMLQIATAGSPAINANVGELYVSYDITYFKPKATFGSTILTANFRATDHPAAAHGNFWGASVGIVNYQAPPATDVVYDNIGITVLNSDLVDGFTQWKIPAGISGTFIIGMHYSTIGGVIATAGEISPTTNMIHVSKFGWGPLYMRDSAVVGETATTEVCYACLKIVDPSKESVFTTAGFTIAAVGYASQDLFITEWNTKAD